MQYNYQNPQALNGVTPEYIAWLSNNRMVQGFGPVPSKNYWNYYSYNPGYPLPQTLGQGTNLQSQAPPTTMTMDESFFKQKGPTGTPAKPTNQQIYAILTQKYQMSNTVAMIFLKLLDMGPTGTTQWDDFLSHMIQHWKFFITPEGKWLMYPPAGGEIFWANYKKSARPEFKMRFRNLTKVDFDNPVKPTWYSKVPWWGWGLSAGAILWLYTQSTK